MRVFAQISGGICVAITQAKVEPSPVAGDQFVEVPSFDTHYLGRGYLDGAWVDA